LVVRPEAAEELVIVSVLFVESGVRLIPVPGIKVKVSLLPEAVTVVELTRMFLNVLTEGWVTVEVIVVPEILIPVPAVRVTSPV